jgi:hypothetical protein
VTAVLFLDIDGVLNSDRYRYTREWAAPATDLIDPAAVAILNEITRRWEMKVVVSSSWGVMPNVHEILRGKGVEAEIIGSTPAQPGPRGEEIRLWLADHSEIIAFVILDDDCDMGDLIDYLVRTDARYGLQPADIESVASVIERQKSMLLFTPQQATG